MGQAPCHADCDENEAGPRHGSPMSRACCVLLEKTAMHQRAYVLGWPRFNLTELAGDEFETDVTLRTGK